MLSTGYQTNHKLAIHRLKHSPLKGTKDIWSRGPKDLQQEVTLFNHSIPEAPKHIRVLGSSDRRLLDPSIVKELKQRRSIQRKFNYSLFASGENFIFDKTLAKYWRLQLWEREEELVRSLIGVLPNNCNLSQLFLSFSFTFLCLSTFGRGFYPDILFILKWCWYSIPCSLFLAFSFLSSIIYRYFHSHPWNWKYEVDHL